MKKRKITYSLTAQQKKQLKRQEKGEKIEEPKSEESEEKVAEQKNNRVVIICAVAIVLAVAMIILAVFIPVWTSAETVTNDTFYSWRNFNPNDPNNPYNDENPNPNPPVNPIATITLTGDDKNAFKSIFGKEEIEISTEIFIDDAPYSSMNFIYLAESGFYDGTIIHDVNRGHAMFSGFTSAKNGQNKVFERNYIHNLTGFNEHNISSCGSDNFKLGYRFNTETKRSQASNSADKLGYLVMMSGKSYYGTSTSFMFITNNNPQFYFGDSSTKIESYMSWVGRADIDSMDYIKKLDSAILSSKVSGNFHVPDTTIRIKSIRTDLSKARKEYLLANFESLLSGAKEGSQSSTSWDKTAYNSDTYYKFAE